MSNVEFTSEDTSLLLLCIGFVLGATWERDKDGSQMEGLLKQVRAIRPKIEALHREVVDAAIKHAKGEG